MPQTPPRIIFIVYPFPVWHFLDRLACFIPSSIRQRATYTNKTNSFAAGSSTAISSHRNRNWPLYPSFGFVPRLVQLVYLATPSPF